MEVYAAMIDRMDQGVGKIVAELKRTGQFDNTLILFLQDNGGCAEPMGREPRPRRGIRTFGGPKSRRLPAMKPEDFAAAGSVPAQTRDGYPVRMGPKVMPGPDGHLHRLRPRLGERLEHAVPRIQALGPRGRHQHAADRPLAGGDCARRANFASSPAT